MDEVDIIWKIWVSLARLLRENSGPSSMGLRITGSRDMSIIPKAKYSWVSTMWLKAWISAKPIFFFNCITLKINYIRDKGHVHSISASFGICSY